MPLHLESISTRATKGDVLRWILETGEVRKQQVGSIVLRERQAIVDIPNSVGPRVARGLDGRVLSGRRIEAWFADEQTEARAADHFDRLNRWLGMEEREEARRAAEIQQATGAGGASTSTRLAGLVLRREESGLGGHVLLTLGRRSPMESLPVTELGVGTPIRIQTLNAPTSDARRGVVTRLERTEIEVAVSRRFDDQAGETRYQIDPAEDETSLRRTRTALARVRHARGDRLSELREVCLGLREAQFDMGQAAPEFFHSDLNDTQREAIAYALSARDLAIIHGPPGTGKTTTLVELIRQAVRRGDRVLACAPSNLGVDNLFERLIRHGEQAVRLGHVARVVPHLRDQTLAVLAAAHPRVRDVRKLRLEAAAILRKAEKSSRSDTDWASRRELQEEARALLKDARQTETDITDQILRNATVICATNTGLDAELLGGRRFDLVVIDEACQCTEAACWIPMQRAERVVLAGDHCQLPPTVLSQEAAREGFGISLQERLIEMDGDRLARPLLIQYRMHEEIMRHSSDVFYGSRLCAHESVVGHRLCDLPGVREEEFTSGAVRFIDTSGGGHVEEREPGGESLCNREEAALAVKKVRDLIQCGVRGADIAVITPYSAQVQTLRDLLGSDPADVEVGTVDGFQGREKEAVIVSLVRCNNEGQVGFLNDIRRMNVALTRARRKLIVIGNSATISGHPFYAGLLEYFDRVGAYYGVWDEV